MNRMLHMADAQQPNQPPNWDEVSVDVLCPRCGYNLRTLTGYRCPECGLQLDWNDIVSAAYRVLENPLFEYQCATRPVRSFLLTAWRCLTPLRLWRGLAITDRPRIAPLVIFAVFCLLIRCVLPIWGAAGKLAVNSYASYYHWGGLVYVVGEFLKDLRHLLEVSYSYFFEAMCLYIAAAFCAYLWLQLFSQTIARYKIHAGQLARVTVYSIVPAVFFRTLESAIASATNGYDPFNPVAWYQHHSLFGVLADVLVATWVLYSFCCGLTVYLRIKRGICMALTAVFLSALSWTTSVLGYSSYCGEWDNLLSNPVYKSSTGVWHLVSWTFGIHPWSW